MTLRSTTCPERLTARSRIAPDRTTMSRKPCATTREGALRVAVRALAERVELLAATAVDNVRDTVPRREALVVVVVARKNKVDAVTLEERHPPQDDRRIAEVAPAGVGGVVKGDDLPGRGRGGEMPLQPTRLPSPTEFELRTKRSKLGRERW